MLAVTITDVAKLAGVSPSTVSRTCKNSSAISNATKEKVRQAMIDLGYQHPFVQNHRKPKTIGIIFPTFRPSISENPFYLEALHGISGYCNQHGINSVIHIGDTTEELLAAVENSSAQGFIFLYSDVDDKLIQYMYTTNKKFVLIGKATTNINDTIYVDTDNVEAGKEACDYLIGLKHQKIAYIGTDKARVFSSDRKAGYLLSLSQNQIPYREDFIVELPSRITDDYSSLEKLFANPADAPTALILCDDMLAIAVLAVLKKLNLRVPEDVSLISFNNSLLTKLATPGLTSIDINAFQLGHEACAQLCKHLEDANLVATKTLIPHQIIYRDSCAAPKK